MVLTMPRMSLDQKNLVENYRKLCALAKKSVCAVVVKDDAYGLGASWVVKALYKEGCRDFFVAHGVEGEVVRKAAPKATIYVLQGMGEDSVSYFKKNKLTPVISSLAEFEFWKQNRIKGIKPIINVETGLNRLGFREEDIKKLSVNDKAEFSYVMSHLSSGDDKNHFMNDVQLKALQKMRAYFPGIKASLSASDGVFLGNAFHFDMVRLGAAVYGLNTAPYREKQMDEVMFVKAPVLQIVDVKEGEYVGYGAAYQALSDMRVAIVSIGYGDGLPRNLTGRGRCFYNGQEARFVGRLSMDNIMCDVTKIDNIVEGDLVDILNESYTADEMGKDAGTIGYEILSNMGKGNRFIKTIKK